MLAVQATAVCKEVVFILLADDTDTLESNRGSSVTLHSHVSYAKLNQLFYARHAKDSIHVYMYGHRIPSHLSASPLSESLILLLKVLRCTK